MAHNFKRETDYNRSSDITYIFYVEYDRQGYPLSRELTGWYHGEPNESYTDTFDGELKAEYFEL